MARQWRAGSRGVTRAGWRAFSLSGCGKLMRRRMARMLRPASSYRRTPN